MDTQVVFADFNFLKRSDLYLTEKPYRLQYEPDNGLARTNIELDIRPKISIQNLRHTNLLDKYDQTGFEVAHLETSLSEASFYNDEDIVRVYYSEVSELLAKRFKPKEIKIMEHQVRKRHQDHPISIGEDYDYFQPTTIVHSDYTPNSAGEVIEGVLRVDMENYKRIIAVNVWRPLFGPIADWPIALCDASTADMELDYQPSDIVARGGYTENCRMHYNESSKWYYLRGQMANEALIFRQFDTDICKAPVPHTGFADTSFEDEGRPRESIEVRAFMFFD